MESLFERSKQKLRNVPMTFTRSLMEKINWDWRLIGIKGARGIGKTTMMLQYMKLNLPADHQTIYISLDNIWFNEHKLYNFTDDFVKRGGKYLLIDEIHKYPEWSQELKNIYDDFPDLKIVFTGSSMLEILNARADLSRRAVVYTMQGFSFREYLNMNLKLNLPTVSLNEIIVNHLELSERINGQLKVFEHFDFYLKNGYYPFYKEAPSMYHYRISEIVNMILEIELPLLRNVDQAFIPKVKQLLQIIAESVPFSPNTTKLSERIGITRKSLLMYLHALDESRLTNNIEKDAQGISRLQKPVKILLENTNLMYALYAENIEQGTIRETFFVNQIKEAHTIQNSKRADFIVDQKYTFEVGGKNKTSKQVAGISDAYIAADDLEYGYGNKIPLWLFGLMY